MTEIEINHIPSSFSVKGRPWRRQNGVPVTKSLVGWAEGIKSGKHRLKTLISTTLYAYQYTLCDACTHYTVHAIYKRDIMVECVRIQNRYQFTGMYIYRSREYFLFSICLIDGVFTTCIRCVGGFSKLDIAPAMQAGNSQGRRSLAFSLPSTPVDGTYILVDSSTSRLRIVCYM